MIYRLSDKKDLYRFEVAVANLKSKGAMVLFEEKREQRSLRQNNAIHLYCEMIADTLNDMGHTFSFIGIKGMEMELPYSKTLVKETIWKPIQMALFEKESTTDLTKDEVSEVSKPIEHFFAKNGINLPFPSYD